MNLLRLPKSCQDELMKLRGKDLVRELFNFSKKNIKYSLDSCNKSKIVKSPAEVWNTKKGHCFELSYFLIACLNFLNKKHNLRLKTYYLEQPNFKIKDKVWDHASVMVEFPNRKRIILDLGRGIFGAKYKVCNKLYGKKIIENYDKINKRYRK